MPVKITLERYIKDKVKILKELGIRLNVSQIDHLRSLTTEVDVDRYARDLIINNGATDSVPEVMETVDINQECFTPRDISILLGVSNAQPYYWIRTKKMNCILMPGSVHPKITKHQLLQFLYENPKYAERTPDIMKKIT